MEHDYTATVTATIHAPITEVWAALTTPEQIAEYMHGANVKTDWRVGSPITWSGEMNGKAYEDKGEILAFDQPNLLKVTHWSPLGGSEDKPENYHTVEYRLTEDGGTTQVVLTQSNNPTQEAADAMAKEGWQPVLDALKAVVEIDDSEDDAA